MTQSSLRSLIATRKAVITLGALIVATACTHNPATGKRQFSLIGEQQEIAMGLQYDKGVTAEFGLYPDEAWQTYIQEIGDSLAAVSERSQLPWQFKVVDDDTVNAFAVPGGFIYMTRGILAYFNSEAQLATVMGHEIGHVTARHSVEKISQFPPEQQEGTIKRNEYLRRLDGMKFGVDPRQGYSVGSTFYHPDMAFRMDFPKDWRIVNQRQLVAGVNEDQNAFVVLTLAQESNPREAEQAFFSQEGIRRGSQWQKGFRHFEVTPKPDPSGRTGVPIRGTVGFRSHQGTVFRLICYTSADRWQNYRQAMHRSLPSFKRLTNKRYLNVHAKKLRIIKLPREMSLEQFNRQNPSTIELNALAVLNGVQATETIPKGTLVKRVVGADPPSR